MFGEKNGMREKTRKQRRQTDKSKKKRLASGRLGLEHARMNTNCVLCSRKERG
jgi:hypothetical protein